MEGLSQITTIKGSPVHNLGIHNVNSNILEHLLKLWSPHQPAYSGDPEYGPLHHLEHLVSCTIPHLKIGQMKYLNVDGQVTHPEPHLDYLSVCVYVCVVSAHECGAYIFQKMALDLQEVKWQAVDSLSVWVLGTKLRSSIRAVPTLQPHFFFFLVLTFYISLLLAGWLAGSLF